MKREHRQLHAKSHQEAEVAEQTKASPGRTGCELGEVEGDLIARKGQGQAADQDQQRGEGGVEDEFGGGVLAVLTTPDGDQQVHRHQLELPGQEEQQKVLGQEHHALGGGLNQKQGEIQPRFALNRPARRNGEEGHQSAEDHQGSGEAVGSEGPLQSDGGEPADPFNQLKPLNCWIEPGGEHRQHQQQVCQQNHEGEVARPGGRCLVIPWQQGHQQGAESRQQDDQGQPGKGRARCCVRR